MVASAIIYDWNRIKKGGPFAGKRFEILDETLHALRLFMHQGEKVVGFLRG